MASTNLKVGLVLDTSLDSTDGVPQYVIDLGQWLSSQGHEVHYLVGESKRNDLANIHSLSTNTSIRFNGNRTTIPLYANRKRIRTFMNEYSFDVLHVQTPHHPFLAQPIIRSANKSTAIVGTFHVLPYGRMSALSSKLLGYWLKPSLQRIDQMIAVSDVAAVFCKQVFKLDSVVIPNMINYERFHKAKPLSNYHDEKVLTIMFLGRLVERKGCRLLITALSILYKNKSLPPFRAIICGRGAQEAELRRYVKDLGLDNIIQFMGYISEEDKPSYYASADIAVFPSKSGESFGIVLLEAMANGHSVVLAGNNPGYASVMSPHPDLLFNPNEATELAEKICYMLKDKVARSKAAAWGENYAQDFDVDNVGQRILKVYNKALLKRLRT